LWYISYLVRAEKEDLISMRTDIIPSHPFADKRSLHFYHVTCKALGEQDLVITIGNKASESNQYPASSNVTIKFACMVPASLTLEPDVQLPEISERRLSLQDCQSPNKEV
jgi:nuclear pore complex protein Nup210